MDQIVSAMQVEPSPMGIAQDTLALADDLALRCITEKPFRHIG